MKKLSYGIWDIFISSNRFEEDMILSKGNYIEYLKRVILRLLGGGYQLICYSTFIKKYSEKLGIRKFAILDAHGFIVNGSWRYEDSGNYYPVQEWINERDGDYLALLLHVCNPNGCSVYSSKSILIVPKTSFSLIRRLEFGNVKVEIYVPNIGFVDMYNIEDAFNHLYNSFSFNQQLRYFLKNPEKLIKFMGLMK